MPVLIYCGMAGHDPCLGKFPCPQYLIQVPRQFSPQFPDDVQRRRPRTRQRRSYRAGLQEPFLGTGGRGIDSKHMKRSALKGRETYYRRLVRIAA
jgi:hypothetical protein